MRCFACVCVVVCGWCVVWCIVLGRGCCVVLCGVVLGGREGGTGVRAALSYLRAEVGSPT